MRNVFKKCSKAVSLSMALVMTLSMAGCGSKESGNNDTANVQNEKAEFTYVPEYITMDDEDARFYNAQISGDCLYYSRYVWDEASQTGYDKFISYSLKDKKVLEEKTLNMEEEQRSIGNYYTAEDGSMTTVEYLYTDNGENFTYLCKYDAQGNAVKTQDISSIINENEEYGYVDKIQMDKQGRIYLSCSEIVRLFDEELQYNGQVTLNGWISGMTTGSDGKVYAVYYDNMATDNSSCIAEVDFEGKKMGAAYKNFPNGNGKGIVAGGEKEFITYNDTGIYTYDGKTQTYETMAEWLDCDINGTYVDGIGILADGRIVALINEWGTGNSEIALLTKTPMSEVAQKTEVVIGTLSMSQDLQAAAVQFNKSSDTYHVTIKSYVDEYAWTETSYEDGMNRLNSELMSNTNCPDIIDLSYVNMKQAAAKGVITDLVPFLDKSTLVSKVDYLQNVIEGYTVNGKLMGIPKTFSMQTFVGKTSDLGEEPGWTLAEMIAYAEANPDAELLEYMTKEQLLQTFLMYNQDQFIDWENGKCNFESDEFKALLTFVTDYPSVEEYEWDDDGRSTPIKIQAGEILMDSVYLDEFNAVQMYEAMFGEPVTYIGYPTSDGSNGCMMTATDAYGIVEKSQNKEGAWAFIEHYLANESSSIFSYGFPTNKVQMDALVEEALNVEYVKDENGELVLDEEGNPIPLNGGGGMSFGDWEYTYRPATKEEVDLVLELMESAKTNMAYDTQILSIILEEAQPFFNKQKTVSDVAAVIQSRIQLYISENQ